MFHYLKNKWAIFAHDLLWVPVAITIAYWLRFNFEGTPASLIGGYERLMLVAAVIHASSFWLFGCYRGVWRFASIPDFVRIFLAVGLGTLATLMVMFVLTRVTDIPRSVMVLYPLVLAGGVSGARVFYRALVDHGFSSLLSQRNGKLAPRRVVVIGAGAAGEALVRDLRRFGEYRPVCFLDDDIAKQGHELHGVRVRGTISDLPRIVQRYEVEVALIAIPTASREVMDRIVAQCAETHIEFRTLPSLRELADGRADIQSLRAVTVEDLLGRDPVRLDDDAIEEFISGHRVLVSGGGGSIGQELCRQVAQHHPRALIILENSEFNLYRVEGELRARFPDLKLHTVLCDVADAARVEFVFSRYRPDIVFHAAAFKHVPIVEHNVVAGVRNNVLGTRRMADASIRHKTKKFVLISTDKVVNPTNVMGATKRAAELYCQSLGRDSGTEFITTRFGNVLGSCGSVVPLFEEQIRKGGPVTVTDPEITRFFMTITEASGLILQAAVIGNGGEIFVMDMGVPVKIGDLAEKMIRLSGRIPGKDFEIIYTGRRPGEKLHEELFYDQEDLVETSHPRLMKASSPAAEWQWISNELTILEGLVDRHDETALLECLRRIVPQFDRFVPHPELEAGVPDLRVVR